MGREFSKQASSAFAKSDEEIEVLREAVRKGRLFDVQAWIASGRPLLNNCNHKKKHPLRLAIEHGFHSMVEILAAAWPDKETLNEELSRTLAKKRVDLFWILLENGADMKSVYLHEVASCCDRDLMKFYFDHWDEVGGQDGLYKVILAMPYPLTGMIKEFAPSVPNHKEQLGKAINYFVRENSLRWVAMSIWMGADPRLPAPWPDSRDDPDEWVAPIELAVNGDTFEVLKFFKPSAETDDLDKLLEQVSLWDHRDFQVAEYLLSLGANVNNKANGGCSILDRLFCKRFSIHRHWHKNFWDLSKAEEWIEKGARFVPDSYSDLRGIREYICHVSQSDVKRLMLLLLKCMPEELLLRIVNNVRVRKHFGFTPTQLREKLEKWQKPPPPRVPFILPQRTRLEQAPPRLVVRQAKTLTRHELYEQIWRKPAVKLGQEWGISDVAIAKICKRHNIPKPGRGFWAKKRNGHKVSAVLLPNPDRNPEIHIHSHNGGSPIEDGEIRQHVEALVDRLSEEQQTVEIADTEELHPIAAGKKLARQSELSNDSPSLPCYSLDCDDRT